MKLLLDANLSPTIRAGLETAGHEVAHVGDAELLHASDREILDYAGAHDLVIVTADSDFASMLALAGQSGLPSCSFVASRSGVPPFTSSFSWRTSRRSPTTSTEVQWSR